MARQPGLTPQQSSFLFTLKNDLLVTKERQFRLNKAPDPDCFFCGEVESHTHILTCVHNIQVTDPLINLLHSYMTNITPEQIMLLDWDVAGTAAELGLLITTVVCLSYVWVGQLHLMKQTNMINDTTIYEEICKNHF